MQACARRGIKVHVAGVLGSGGLYKPAQGTNSHWR
jgi:hypothetical protein